MPAEEVIDAVDAATFDVHLWERQARSTACGMGLAPRGWTAADGRPVVSWYENGVLVGSRADRVICPACARAVDLPPP